MLLTQKKKKEGSKQKTQNRLGCDVRVWGLGIVYHWHVKILVISCYLWCANMLLWKLLSFNSARSKGKVFLRKCSFLRNDLDVIVHIPLYVGKRLGHDAHIYPHVYGNSCIRLKFIKWLTLHCLIGDCHCLWITKNNYNDIDFGWSPKKSKRVQNFKLNMLE